MVSQRNGGGESVLTWVTFVVRSFKVSASATGKWHFYICRIYLHICFGWGEWTFGLKFRNAQYRTKSSTFWEMQIYKPEQGVSLIVLHTVLKYLLATTLIVGSTFTDVVYDVYSKLFFNSRCILLIFLLTPVTLCCFNFSPHDLQVLTTTNFEWQ